MTITPGIIIELCAALAAVILAFTVGRYHPAKSSLEDTRDEAYNQGFDAAAKGYTDPYPDLCPDPGACVKGPDPHSWTTDCEQDEGWGNLDEPLSEPPPNHPVYRGNRLPDEETRTQMFAELAPDDERPAGHTDQFRAISWDHMPWSERQGLIEWDFVMKSKRVSEDFEEFMRDYVAEWRDELVNRGAA